MKITVENILHEYPKLDMKLPKGLQKDSFELLRQSMRWYDEDGEAKGYVDTFIEKLNLVIGENSGKSPQKPEQGRPLPPKIGRAMCGYQKEGLFRTGKIPWKKLERLEESLSNTPNVQESKNVHTVKDRAFLRFYNQYADWFVTGWDGKGEFYAYTVGNGDVGLGRFATVGHAELDSLNAQIDLDWEPATVEEALRARFPDYYKRDRAKGKGGKSPAREKNGGRPQKASKKKAPGQQANIEQVEHFTIEEKFLKRYMLLHGKTKSRGQILNFIKALQKAIEDKQIRKTSRYADDIRHIQDELIRIYGYGYEGVKVNIEGESLDRLKKMFGGKKERLAITYIKRFIGLYGKQTNENTGRLLNLVRKALEDGRIAKSDPYHDRIKAIEKALEEYTGNGDVSITASELRGLAGCVGMAAPKVKTIMPEPYKDTDLVPTTELKKRKFPRLGIKGKWKKVFGNLGAVFHIMVYGQGGKGKSTMVIDFAHYLCKEHGLRVLYVADEEKQGDTFKLKLDYLDAYHPDLVVVGALPKSLKGFDVLVLDSVTTIGITPDELKGVQERNKGLSTIYINQTNKKGEFYGMKKWEHLCSTMVRFEDGELEVKKNRFGDTGTHKLSYYKKRTLA